MHDPLLLAARHGPWVLVSGLVAGLALPGLAAALRPWLPALVVLLLFTSVLRLRPEALPAALRALPSVAGRVLVLQLALPLALLALTLPLGWAAHPAVFALLLMLAAPSVVSSPNLSMMLGAAPDHALHLMVVGACLLPVTILPVLALAPAVEGGAAVVTAALTLVATILLTGLAALGVRRVLLSDAAPLTQTRLDGASSIVLAVFVIGLMEAVTDLAVSDPVRLLFWTAFAFAANLGAQALTWRIARNRTSRDRALQLALVAGNRNVALFLVSLPPETTAPVLAFIGCYQLPMFLTPLILRRYYRA